MKLTINQKYYDLVPRPKKEEYNTLRDSIIIEGQKDPIVINSKGVVLDGHTRYEILQNLGKTPIYRKKDFPTKDEEELYVMSTNTNRRQLNDFQKAEIFYTKYLEFKKQAKFNASNSNYNVQKFPLGGSAERYGLFLGVSQKKTYQTLKLISLANENLKVKLRNGSITVNQAYNQIMNKRKSRVGEKKLPSTKKLLEFLPPEDREILRNMIQRYNYAQ
jgi:hypothetical protein